jgi:hypothetical protein
MPNSKISALTSATTPLAGTEVLPVVQSGTTKQVSVANLTAGRSVAAKALTLTDAETYLGLSATGAGGKLWYAISGGGGNVSPGYFCLFNGTSGNKVMTIAPSTSEQFVTDTSGNFQLVAGNLVVSNGKGIDFSATPGTGTSELFADYEEGAWTPVGNGIALTTAIGVYTKIGRAVTFSGNVTFPITANGNPALFTGLPFTVNASAAANGNGTIGSSTYAFAMTGRVLQGFDRWYNFAIGGGLLTNANLSGVSIEFGGTYIV